MKLTRGKISILLKQKKQTFKKVQKRGLPKVNHLGTLKNKKRLVNLHNKTLRKL